MVRTLVEIFKEAGPLAFLNLGAGAMGAVLAVVTLILSAMKSRATKVLAMLCLLCALAALGVGLAGYGLGIQATLRSLGNVPEDMRDLLLRRGTEESRANFLVALGASAFPLLIGALAAALTRFRAGLTIAVLAVAAWTATLVELKRPLPPPGPELIAPAGLQLPRSIAHRPLPTTGLIALTPEGLWVEGKKVASFADALESGAVRLKNRDSLPLMVDARVPFSSLVDLLEAAGAANRHAFRLVVLAADGTNRVLPIVDEKGSALRDDGRPPLLLTVQIKPDQVLIGATGGTLEPVATAEALNSAMAEIKASFPGNDSVRVTADPGVPVERLVAMLDAVNQRDGKLLNTELVVGRFTLPQGERTTHPP